VWREIVRAAEMSCTHAITDIVDGLASTISLLSHSTASEVTTKGGIEMRLLLLLLLLLLKRVNKVILAK